jgi:hypothetical protein
MNSATHRTEWAEGAGDELRVELTVPPTVSVAVGSEGEFKRVATAAEAVAMGAGSCAGLLVNAVSMVRCAFFTMGSAVLGLAALECCCCTVRCFQQQFALSRMPLSFTLFLLRLKRCHACGQCHSSRVSTCTSYRCHCKLHLISEGLQPRRLQP